MFDGEEDVVTCLARVKKKSDEEREQADRATVKNSGQEHTLQAQVCLPTDTAR